LIEGREWGCSGDFAVSVCVLDVVLSFSLSLILFVEVVEFVEVGGVGVVG
jgi:hypothetical protein